MFTGAECINSCLESLFRHLVNRRISTHFKYSSFKVWTAEIPDTKNLANSGCTCRSRLSVILLNTVDFRLSVLYSAS